MKDKQPSAKASTSTRKHTKVFSAEERAAMQERARELKMESRIAEREAEGERDLLAKIAEMPEPDRSMAERIHAIVSANAPNLTPRTYYGMPAWASDGKTVCFFKPASKFKERYATFGFETAARIDEGNMWPTSYALTQLTAGDEKRIAALVKKAVS